MPTAGLVLNPSGASASARIHRFAWLVDLDSQWQSGIAFSFMGPLPMGARFGRTPHRDRPGPVVLAVCRWIQAQAV